MVPWGGDALMLLRAHAYNQRWLLGWLQPYQRCLPRTEPEVQHLSICRAVSGTQTTALKPVSPTRRFGADVGRPNLAEAGRKGQI